MRECRSLVRLSDQGRSRLRKLRGRALVLSRESFGAANREELAGHIVIELQNLWSNYVRSYLLSLLLSPLRKNGCRAVIQNLAVTSPGTLLHSAAIAARGAHAAAPVSRRDEPSWHDVQVFMRTCHRIDPSNREQIFSALAIETRVLQDLPVFRNFYAHRNEGSASRAVELAQKAYLIRGVRHPTLALIGHAPRRPQCVLLDWIDDVGVYMDLLCE